MLVVAPVATRPKSILFATDFSPSCEKTLRHALAIARHYRTKFCMAHVVSSVGFAIAGPEAVEAATEAASRDAIRWENSLAERGASPVSHIRRWFCAAGFGMSWRESFH